MPRSSAPCVPAGHGRRPLRHSVLLAKPCTRSTPNGLSLPVSISGDAMDEVTVAMTTRDVLMQARELASELNSRTVEAEHLLVVLADPCAETGKVLQEAGLNRSRIEAAL